MTQFNVLWCSLPFIVWPPYLVMDPSWTPDGPLPFELIPMRTYGLLRLEFKRYKTGESDMNSPSSHKVIIKISPCLATILDRSNWLCHISIEWKPKKKLYCFKIFVIKFVFKLTWNKFLSWILERSCKNVVIQKFAKIALPHCCELMGRFWKFRDDYIFQSTFLKKRALVHIWTIKVYALISPNHFPDTMLSLLIKYYFKNT